MPSFHLKMTPGLKPHATAPKVKVKDLVTLYWQGYYEVIEVEPRTMLESRGKGSDKPGSGVPLIKALRRADETGKLLTDSHIYMSDATWVTKLTKAQAVDLGLVQKPAKVTV